MTLRNSYRMHDVRGGMLQIMVYGDVFADFFGEGVDAKNIVDVLNENPDVAEIEVRINSVGGSVFDGLAIYNNLRQHAAKKHVFVDGIAASIASVIAMAGDTITMASGSMMMIHNASIHSGGNKGDHARTVEVLTSMDGEMAAIYAAKTGRTDAAMLDLMAAETWFTADEAVAAGLATDIFQLPEDELQAVARLDFSRCGYLKIPGHIAGPNALVNSAGIVVGWTAGAHPTPITAVTTDNGSTWRTTQTTAPTPAPTETNDMKILAQAAGLKSDATDAEIVAKISTLKTRSASASEAVAKADALQAQLTVLTAAIGCEGDAALGTIKALQVSHATVEEVTAKLAAIESATEVDAHAALVKQGKADGKLTADLAKFYADQPSAALKAFLAIAPKVVPMTEHTSPDDKTGSGDSELLAHKGKTYIDMSGNEKQALIRDEPELAKRMQAEFRATIPGNSHAA